MTPRWIYSFSSNLCALLPVLSHAGSGGKEFACNVGDLDLIHGLGRSPEEWNFYPLQYSGLENSKDCIFHGITKSQTLLSNFHLHPKSVLDKSVFNCENLQL